jgi:3'(2'), 5'-bisphosphate nucleotidase
LIDDQPAYGWVYAPSSDRLYVAVPQQPVVKFVGDRRVELCRPTGCLDENAVRLMMGNRDREQHPLVESAPGVELVYSGSVGLRVAMILEGDADVYLHLAGKLKVWDTAAPAAMAMAGGLEIGSFEFDGLPYDSIGKQMHEFPISIGKSGTLAWMRSQPFAAARGR